jgi:hypothetical protein
MQHFLISIDAQPDESRGWRGAKNRTLVFLCSFPIPHDIHFSLNFLFWKLRCDGMDGGGGGFSNFALFPSPISINR